MLLRSRPPDRDRRRGAHPRMPGIKFGASLRTRGVILMLSRLMRLYGKPVFVR